MPRTRRVENLRHGARTTTAGTREGSTITVTASPHPRGTYSHEVAPVGGVLRRARRFLNHAKLSSRGTLISLIDRRDRDLLASQSPQHTCRVSASSLLRCASSRPTHSWCSRLYAPWGLEARAP